MPVRRVPEVPGERGDAPAACCCEGCEEGAGAVSEVPVYSPAGRLLSFASAAWVEHHAPHLRIVRNRRGHPRRCYLRADDGAMVAFLEATGRRSNYGAAFMQPLTHGRTWALRGVRGSGR